MTDESNHERSRFRDYYEDDAFFEMEWAKIKLLSDCNLRCKKCRYSYQTESTSHSLSFDIMRKILDQLFEAGCKRIKYGGGEPLLHKDIIGIIKYASSLGMETSITTNGTFLQDSADSISESGLSNITVSVDSHRPEVHDDITGRKGSWEKTIKGIKSVRKESDSEIKIGALVTTMNYREADKIVDLAYGLGVKKINFIASKGDFHPLLELTEEDIYFFNNEILPLIHQKSSAYGIKLQRRYVFGKSDPSDLDNRHISREHLNMPCHIPWTHVYINFDGSLYPCCLLEDTGYNMGNVKSEPLNRVLNSEKYRRFRDRSKPPVKIRECASCVDELENSEDFFKFYGDMI